MGFIGHNCSECSHSLPSDFCTAFAANLLMDCELFVVGFFGANSDFVFLRGICDANGIFKCGLTIEFESVNCGANGNFVLQCSDCEATGLVLICELVFTGVSICGAIN